MKIHQYEKHLTYDITFPVFNEFSALMNDNKCVATLCFNEAQHFLIRTQLFKGHKDIRNKYKEMIEENSSDSVQLSLEKIFIKLL